MKTFTMLDLFAGAGGFSEGFRRAAVKRGIPVHLTAINHWQKAVDNHKLNHPDARHFCESVYEVDPKDAVPGGHLDCLVASPECIYHSNARGGGVCDDQSRSGASDIHRWIDGCESIDMIVIENVKEFRDWGPLYRRKTKYKGKWYLANTPIPHQKGKYFEEFCDGLRERGYNMHDMVLNSADYGAYTARKRLFLMARKENPAVSWPIITHAKDPESADMDMRKWRAAREVIDWSLKGESLFARQAGLIPGKKPLVENTIRRIIHGMKKFNNLDIEPFLTVLRGCSNSADINLPLPTVTAGPGNLYLCEPYFIDMHGTGGVKDVADPLPTPTTSGTHTVLVEPVVREVPNGAETNNEGAAGVPGQAAGEAGQSECGVAGGECDARGRAVSETDAVAAGGGVDNEHAIEDDCDSAAAVQGDTNQGARSGTPTAGCEVESEDGDGAMVGGDENPAEAGMEPFLTVQKGNSNSVSIEEPLPTLTCKDMLGAVNPVILHQMSGMNCVSVDKPLPTITTVNGHALLKPCLVHSNYSGAGPKRASDPDDPLPTVTTKTSIGFAKPYLTKYHGGVEGHKRVLSLENPIPTIDTSNRYTLVQPKDGEEVESGYLDAFLVKYFSCGENAVSLDLPCPTITTKDRLALVEAEMNGRYILDIFYRILEPHELAKGMGFEGYEFVGTKTDIKKMIGNAVEVHQSEALAGRVLDTWLELVA